MKKLLGLATVVGMSAMMATACGAPLTKGYVMLVTAEGSKTDGTFNESSYNGIKEATIALKTKITTDEIETKSGEESKLKESILSAIEKGAETMILPGFNQAHKSLMDIANDHGNRNFLVLDTDGYFGADGFVANSSAKNKNITSALYAVEQAAFLAGYATQIHMHTTLSKKINYGVWGGVAYPSVYSFMSGFRQGVMKAVETTGTDTAEFLLPKAGATQGDYYVGNFNAGSGTTIANTYLNANADILLPVAGPQTADAIAAIKAKNGSTAKVIGVDVDAKGLYPSDATHILTSITKNLDTTVLNYLKTLYDGEKINGLELGKTYMGNLDNKGVGYTAIDGVTIAEATITLAKATDVCNEKTYIPATDCKETTR